MMEVYSLFVALLYETNQMSNLVTPKVTLNTEFEHKCKSYFLSIYTCVCLRRPIIPRNRGYIISMANMRFHNDKLSKRKGVSQEPLLRGSE